MLRKLLCSIAPRIAAAALAVAASGQAAAFCGFYAGKADATLYNEASQVILVRDGDRTVISMRNDFRGPPGDFALVVPVPTLLERNQIHIGDPAIFSRIDAFSAPRLAEYHDPDPCQLALLQERRELAQSAPAAGRAKKNDLADDKALGVAVEASYTVGEYDIVMLSAQQSDGLETWLTTNGYRIPAGASKALAPYIKLGMKFFVAKVNLTEQANLGAAMLRPLQFAFESPRFMLPLRLGMLNANGPQDLIVYAITRHGRVESSNYRTVKLPSNLELPVFVRGSFGEVYGAMFDKQAKAADYKTVFTEYFWDMSWCDPCADRPLSPDELRRAGVFWPGSATMLTRLHMRYTRDSTPEDLMLQQTGDRANWQTRFVLRHPFKIEPSACPQARGYIEGVLARRREQAQTLAGLTGWSISDIARRSGETDLVQSPSQWWKQLW